MSLRRKSVRTSAAVHSSRLRRAAGFFLPPCFFASSFHLSFSASESCPYIRDRSFERSVADISGFCDLTPGRMLELYRLRASVLPPCGHAPVF